MRAGLAVVIADRDAAEAEAAEVAGFGPGTKAVQAGRGAHVGSTWGPRGGKRDFELRNCKDLKKITALPIPQPNFLHKAPEAFGIFPRDQQKDSQSIPIHPNPLP